MNINYKWVRRTQDDYGSYVDSNGVRYIVEWCHRLLTPNGSTEEENGYEKYASVEEACEAWGLAPYVDPEAVMEADIINTIEEEENN